MPVDDVPPDVAARLVRALDRNPSSVVTLIDSDLRVRWISHSATWVTGTDPATRLGADSLERIHPDDVERLLHGLAQLRAASQPSGPSVPVVEPIRYRFKRFDGQWVVLEAQVHNLLDDPDVNGMVVIARPVDGGVDAIGHVVDLLVADAPATEVLAACAALVPRYLGSAAVVGLLGNDPLIGAPADGPARRLVADDRWWRDAVADGRVRAPVDFGGFPDDLAEAARAEGFRSAWVSPLADATTGDVIGCVVVWVRLAVESNIATDQALLHTVRLASLVIGEQRRHHVLRREAVTDPLTGVGNRSALRRRLDATVGPVTVAIVDLDQFKPVNDTYGHDAGDAVLKVIAERLLATVREDDLVVRFGGDEFAVVFAEDASGEGVRRSARRIVTALEAPIPLDGGVTVTVGASLGLATGPATEVIHLADAALYDAKHDKQARHQAG
ncbi:MAG: diguanylate cyclase [Acidimicrobiales bacterium]